MGELDEIVSEFLIESYENLDAYDRDMLVLEQRPDDGAVLSSVFRTVHTIKGTCGFLGFSRLEALAHVGENLLGRLRDGVLHVTPDIASALLAMGDAIRSTLEAIEATGEEHDDDQTALIANLEQLASGETTPPSSDGTETATGDAHRAGDEDDRVGHLLVERGATDDEAVLFAAAEQQLGDDRRIGEILTEDAGVDPEEVTGALSEQAAARGTVADATIRVDVGLLDGLMNLVGELVLVRNQIVQLTGTDVLDASMLGASQRLNLITTELQEGVMKTRMQPIGNLWGKIPRVVRDLSLASGKQVRVDRSGEETELDKSLLEAIKDPLTHLVRNAVDHGIETPEVRQAADKPAEGVLRLRAYHEGGQVNIEIGDDGAGIDVERVKAKAVQRDLVTRERAASMGEREALSLIFLPGFSTAETVTNVSGRGVGMDVVKTNIEKIGGTVDIATERGRGTTFKVKIPLTLAIIPALVVSTGGQRYAIPQVNLVELVRLEGEQARRGIEEIHGAPVYRLRGHLLPLVHLDRELGTASTRADDAVNIVVLQADGRTFGLVVDHVNDTEEIVVKPLGAHLKGIAVLAGATIMGDGRVALILDVLGLAQRARVLTESQGRSTVDAALAAGLAHDDEDTERLLIVAFGAGRQIAIPLSQISRLEEFPATAVEHAGHQEVVRYRGRILPLVRLTSLLGGATSGADDMIQVVVYERDGLQVGFVVDRVLDIVDERVDLQSRGSGGIQGSAVIQGHVTDVVDVSAVIDMANVNIFVGS